MNPLYTEGFFLSKMMLVLRGRQFEGLGDFGSFQKWNHPLKNPGSATGKIQYSRPICIGLTITRLRPLILYILHTYLFNI